MWLPFKNATLTTWLPTARHMPILKAIGAVELARLVWSTVHSRLEVKRIHIVDAKVHAIAMDVGTLQPSRLFHALATCTICWIDSDIDGDAEQLLTSAYMVFHAESLTGIEFAFNALLITFLLLNQPYPQSMNLPPMFPPLLATTTSVLLHT